VSRPSLSQRFDPLDDLGLAEFDSDRQNHVGPFVAAAIEDYLKIVGNHESLGARLVAGNEELVPRQFGKRSGVLAAIIAAPDQPENVCAIDAVVGPKVARKNRRVESLEIDALGQAVRNEDPLSVKGDSPLAAAARPAGNSTGTESTPGESPPPPNRIAAAIQVETTD